MSAHYFTMLLMPYSTLGLRLQESNSLQRVSLTKDCPAQHHLAFLCRQWSRRVASSNLLRNYSKQTPAMEGTMAVSRQLPFPQHIVHSTCHTSRVPPHTIKPCHSKVWKAIKLVNRMVKARSAATWDANLGTSEAWRKLKMGPNRNKWLCSKGILANILISLSRL